MYSYLATAELCGSFGAFINLATDGPSVTVARGGDYSVRAGASAYNNSGAAGKTVFFGAAVGNTTPVAQAAVAIPGALGACVGVEDRLNAVAASAVLKCRYETLVDASSQFQGRWISVRPVRLI